MNVNYELYKVFYHVAIFLNFSKAAKALYISQSAVSQSILLLEKSLGTTLFIRSTKKVVLTNEGEILFSHIEPAINSILQGEKQLLETSTLNRGRLHIGVSDTICKYYLIDYLKEFHELYPNIDILITNRTSIECVDLLKRNSVDIILSNLPNDVIDDSLTVIETISFQDITVAPISYEELTHRKVGFEELSTYPILLLDKQSSTTHFLQSTFNAMGLPLKAAIELGSIDLLVDMASIGLGITFIPDYVLKKPNPKLFIIDTETKLQKRKLGIITQAKTPLSTATKAFISCIIS